MKMNLKYMKTLLLAASFGIYTGCQPDEFEDSNGLEAGNLSASFTVTPVAGKINTFLLQAATDRVLAVKWDKFATGSTSLGRTIDTVYYPDAGSYDVKLEVIGIGGVSASTTKTIDVPTSDPVAGNLVVDPKFDAADNSQHWKFITISAGVTMQFSNGGVVATGGAWGHAAVYQPIQVEAGRKYNVDLDVSGSGATDVWFELYVGTTVPSNGSDYSDGGIRLCLNTWAGCGKTPFNGKLSSLSCGTFSGKTFTATTTGTVYLLIKTGGDNLGTSGIKIDNVEFRGTK